MNKVKQFPGVYRAVVTNNKDPKKQRRLQVEIVTSLGHTTEWVWPMEPANISTEVPEIGQGVWVHFQAGDHEFPTWFGAFGKHKGKSKRLFVKPLNDSVSTTSIQDVIIINTISYKFTYYNCNISWIILLCKATFSNIRTFTNGTSKNITKYNRYGSA